MRVAVLGCGSIGRRHARNLLALGMGASDLVLYDPDPAAQERLEGIRGEFVTALDAVWQSGPRVVFVTSPTDRHVSLALEAARRGCDLFIEKPLSHTLEGVETLCREVEARRLVSMVGCNMRFHPGPALVRELLQTGAVGRVLAARIHTGSYLPDWRPGTDYRHGYSASAERGGGAILDCIHEIDLALWYFGDAALLFAATSPADSIGLDVDVDVEGVAELLLRHGSGALSSVHLSFVQRDYQRECTIVGTEGTLSWRFAEPCVRWRGNAVEPEREYPLPSGWQLNDMYLDELRAFLPCVESRAATPQTVRQGQAVLGLALEAKASALTRVHK